MADAARADSFQMGSIQKPARWLAFGEPTDIHNAGHACRVFSGKRGVAGGTGKFVPIPAQCPLPVSRYGHAGLCLTLS